MTESKGAIVISTSSFGTYSRHPLEMVETAGYKARLNPHGRKMTKEEIVSMLAEVKPCGLLAGTEKLSRDVLEHARPFLRVISRVGVGMDSVDVAAAKELGMAVYSTPDAPTQAVAELAVGLMLSVLRKISLADRQIRQGNWKPVMGNLLGDKTVGIIGLGRIGRNVAGILANGFKANLAGYDPYLGLSAWADVPCRKVETIGELLAVADIVSIHVPGQGQSGYLIGDKEINAMKDSAVLINVSRGGLVDETALKKALDAGKLGGAGLDVFETEPYTGPLLESDRIVMTMHMGSYAREARIKMETEAVQNLLKGLDVVGVRQ